ncbi:hypothetical protein SISNIDRAFT_452213 [Sistotremastrum niveocremeum HHB9708]|uniref:Tetratricopeptide repeat protein 39B n=2 Tax=Sistotremastraceae TaxID=3402574 RepID=A0A164X1F3_9AGAM|nr:hypothetical protein SISNIDRAFT_452213 [Sistotremastrum niveocremeum HHB9708]KZT41024.1 hypothetical protein SISSUDRAFT_1043320 [Sistotremastrum suecicum HHB10207 ss-3]
MSSPNGTPLMVSQGPPPPKVTGAYKISDALVDLPGVRYAVSLFLESHMVECEEWCDENDPKKERLYYASGYGLIQTVKALMSYEDEDILAAIGHAKNSIAVAVAHRKKHSSIVGRVAGFVMGSAPSVSFIKSMTPVERHAELVFAEMTWEKAILGVVYSGDWFQFVKEALAMRTSISIYRALGKYLEAVDAEAPNGHDTSIDNDFRSGVLLGIGMTSLVLSLLPTRVISIVELFGYKGNRKEALEMLGKPGGWDTDGDEPLIGVNEEGVRRPICDMALLMFHLVMSSFTFNGIDIDKAAKILQWNLKRYPTGVFFLFGEGRLRLQRSQPALAIESYQKAMDTQDQYKNLHYISYWEIAMANMSLWDITDSLRCWRKLKEEATWSKACYTYGVAVCLLELGSEEQKAEAVTLFEKVPTLMQKIAGKSIPIEKFVARKARKFQKQNHRLTLPGLEFAYLFLCIGHAPRSVVRDKMLPLVESRLEKLKACEEKPETYEDGQGYWDDMCLANFLQGVCCRYLAFPDADAVVTEEAPPNIEEIAQRSEDSLRAVIANGPKIELDHHLVYHAHYELGRLLANRGDAKEAKKHLDLVLSGKPLEVNTATRKGKYSMENTLIMRTSAAADALEQNRRV